MESLPFALRGSRPDVGNSERVRQRSGRDRLGTVAQIELTRYQQATKIRRQGRTAMYFDIGFGVLLLVAGFRGYRRGFANQTIQIAALGAGILFADDIARSLLPKLNSQFPASIAEPLRLPLLYILSLLIIWLCISTIGAIYLAWYRNRVFGENIPSAGDRLFGLGLGLVKGCVGVAALVYAVNLIPKDFVDRFQPVRQQYDSSRGISIANENRIIDRALEFPEFHIFRERMETVVNHFKNKRSETPPQATS